MVGTYTLDSFAPRRSAMRTAHAPSFPIVPEECACFEIIYLHSLLGPLHGTVEKWPLCGEINGARCFRLKRYSFLGKGGGDFAMATLILKSYS